MFENWKSIIVTATMALAVGFGAGFFIAGKFEKAAEVKVVQKERKESARAVVQTLEADRKLDAEIQKTNATAATIKAAVAVRVQKQEQKSHEVQIQSDTAATLVCPTFDLDVGTVRLLNAARQGADLDSVAGSDEALDAASGIGVKKLLDNDLEIVRMYHDLAKRHDELVTEVEDKLKNDAGANDEK